MNSQLHETYFLQTTDIDLNASGGKVWSIIGQDETDYSDSSDGCALHYDGGGYMIGNVSVGPSATRLAIFNRLCSNYSWYDEDAQEDIYEDYYGSVSNLTVDWSNQGTIGATTIAGISLGAYCINCVVQNLTISGVSSLGFVDGISSDSCTNCIVYNLTIRDCTAASNCQINGIGNTAKNCCVYNLVIDNVSRSSTSTYFIVNGCSRGSSTDCTVDGFSANVSSSSVGRLAGICSSAATNCVAKNLTFNATNMHIGGISAGEYGYPVTNCRVYNAEINANNTKSTYIGGLCAEAGFDVKDNILINVDINVDGTAAIVGGIIGWLNVSCEYDSETGETNSVYVESNYGEVNISLKSISSTSYVGGIIGELSMDSDIEYDEEYGWDTYYASLDVRYNYVKGNIISTSTYSGLYIGSMLGHCDGKYAYFQGNMFSGEISCSTTFGALVGQGISEYFDNNLVRMDTSVSEPPLAQNTKSTKYSNNIITIKLGTIPIYYVAKDKTTLTSYTLAQMQTRSTYTWSNFDYFWSITPTRNDGIPYPTGVQRFVPITSFSGLGTAESPHIINDAAELKAFADNYNTSNNFSGLHWKIADGVESIDLSDYGSWRPIGISEKNPFNGIFHGNRCNITGLTLDNNQTYTGLFGLLDDGARVEWLSVYGNIDYDRSAYVGGIAGYGKMGSMITNCYFEGNITGYINTNIKRNIGSIVGYTENNEATLSYGKATHTCYYSSGTYTGKLQQVYILGSPASIVHSVTEDSLEDLGFDMTENGWGDFTQTEIASANFSIKRNISGKGAILATAGGENVAFDNDDVSVNTYKKGTEVIVEATASDGYAIKSIIIGDTEYTSAVNQNSIVLVYSTANVSKELPIVVVFDNQYSITISNGTHSDQGSTTVSGSNITTTNPYKALKSTSITTTSTATTNTSTLKSYITGVTIDGTLVNISSADNTTTTHTINGITYTITRTKTTGFSTQIVTKITITHTLTKSITISTHYNAQQAVSTSVTLVGGDGTTTSTPTGTITADWGSTTNTLTKTEQTGKTFIGWVVNGQIESQEDTFSTQVTSSTTTITELWAVMYNISLTLPSGTESIKVAHAMTGLIYNLSADTALMAGEWIFYIPDGKTLQVNGIEVANRVTISADSTIAIV